MYSHQFKTKKQYFFQCMVYYLITITDQHKEYFVSFQYNIAYITPINFDCYLRHIIFLIKF